MVVQILSHAHAGLSSRSLSDAVVNSDRYCQAMRRVP